MKFPRLSITLAVLLIAFAVFAACSHFGWLIGLAVLLVLFAKRPSPANRGYAWMAYINTVDSELLIAKRLDIVLEAFVGMLLPIKAFAWGVTNGMTLNELGTDTVLVPYIPLDTAAARDFNAAAGDCYIIDPRDVQKRKVLIDKRKYKGMGITSQQAATMPVLLTMSERQLQLLGHKLAEDVICDVLSIVTPGNFPNETVVGAAGAFDTDVMFEVREDANGFKMPKLGRSAILDDSYYTALLKDNKDAGVYGNSQPRWDAEIPRIAGFDIYDDMSGALDCATDVAAGMVAFQSGILFAQAPVEPTPAILRKLDEFLVFTHEESGLSLAYKRMSDEWCDVEGEIIECTYGKAVGEAAAILRLVAA